MQHVSYSGRSVLDEVSDGLVCVHSIPSSLMVSRIRVRICGGATSLSWAVVVRICTRGEGDCNWRNARANWRCSEDSNARSNAARSLLAAFIASTTAARASSEVLMASEGEILLDAFNVSNNWSRLAVILFRILGGSSSLAWLNSC